MALKPQARGICWLMVFFGPGALGPGSGKLRKPCVRSFVDGRRQ